MGVIFDILGSFIVRAAIISIVLTLMLTLHETLYKNTDRIYLNEVMKAPSETMTHDFKLAGFKSLKTIGIAEANRILFYGAVDSANGAQKMVRYHVSNGILYRTIGGTTQHELARNVTSFTLKYFDVLGTQLAYSSSPISNVKSISVALTIQSKNSVSTIYSGSSDTIPLSLTWQSHFFPLNL